MFKIGDLVKIQEEYVPRDERGLTMLNWVGIVLSYRGRGGSSDQHSEWIIQWSHIDRPSPEYGYYLEVI
jgi:hypothetical protein